MNTKLTLLSIASLTIAVGITMQPASAQRAANRFNFAPNVWRMEETRLPEGYYRPAAPVTHAVKSGHVPNSKDILGIDPSSLPAATPAVTQTRATLTQATPTHYKESFGAPANAPVMAVLPKTATPLTLPKDRNKDISATKAVSAKLMHAKNNNSVNTKVAGKLLKKNHAVGQSGQALALKPASYGKNFGYEPGALVPTTYGDGTSVKTAVSGTLLHH